MAQKNTLAKAKILVKEKALAALKTNKINLKDNRRQKFAFCCFVL